MIHENTFKEAIETLKTVRDLLRFCATQFGNANLFYGHGTTNAYEDALALVYGGLGLPFGNADLLAANILKSECERILNLCQTRLVDKFPVSYLINKAWFAGREYYVDERVLIPRSPIAETIQQQFEPWINAEDVENILDLCTGSGCIAVACADHFPHAMIDAVDLSQDALAVAKINIDNFHLQHQIQLFQGDLFNPLPKKQYDLIISNPPYVDQLDMENLPAEFLHEPHMALAAGENGLELVEKILQKAADYLTEEGVLIVEVGNSAGALMEKYPRIPFTWLEFTKGDAEVFLLRKAEIKKFFK